jgi:hypothetical protein
LHAISKSYMDIENRWIIFDVDNSHLLLSWVCIHMPVIVVDPDNNLAALPLDIMQVRVKMFPSGIPHASDLEQLYLRAMSHRQLFLVELSYFEAFLQCIRQMGFAYGFRVMPGQ